MGLVTLRSFCFQPELMIFSWSLVKLYLTYPIWMNTLNLNNMEKDLEGNNPDRSESKYSIINI